MTYAVAYSSKTGNTELLAHHICKVLGEEGCVYAGAPEAAGAEALAADVVFAGTWTDKGGAAEDARAFLASLRGKRVFLFGTCGFGASEAYFEQVLARVAAGLDKSCELVGSFMCQGKMPAAVRVRYEAMLAAAELGSAEASRAQLFIDNFDEALAHPNADDLAGLERALGKAGV